MTMFSPPLVLCSHAVHMHRAGVWLVPQHQHTQATAHHPVTVGVADTHRRGIERWHSRPNDDRSDAVSNPARHRRPHHLSRTKRAIGSSSRMPMMPWPSSIPTARLRWSTAPQNIYSAIPARNWSTQHYRKVVTKATAVLAAERTRKALAKESLASTFEAELVRKDGSVVRVEARDRLLWDATGTVLGFQGIYRDMTDRRRAEQRLRDSEAKYRTIFAVSPDLMYFTDLTGHLLDANPALLQRTGLTLEQLQQHHVLDFFAGSIPKRSRPHWPSYRLDRRSRVLRSTRAPLTARSRRMKSTPCRCGRERRLRSV